MIDAWKLFVHTGNIETYLLLKEFENDPYHGIEQMEKQDDYTLSSKM
ncbi:YqzL family protein [Virgibacillus sp. W0430]